MKELSRHIDPARVRKLLEKHSTHQVFQLLAENMLPHDHTVDTHSAPSPIEKQPRKIIISREKLNQLRNQHDQLVRIPNNEEEARSLVREWKNGKRVRTEDIVGMILYLNETKRSK